MLFNSLSFLIFFPLTTAIYFLLPRRTRWIHLLLCSCIFYGAFIPSYLLVLLAVILLDFAAGLLIERSQGQARKAFLIVSLLANIGLLALFKYFNFANDNLRALAAFLHWNYPVRDLGIILPIGLSFHTFQSMAYTIEVYRGRQKAERNLGVYSLYVMFYPQLVAGPIERPQNLLHQFREYHPFDADRAFEGLKQMLWGAFKKVVIADRLATFVDWAYGEPSHVGGAALIIATWCFAIQIYCDFSGYSDIAIGAARVLGFRLMTNFDRPYAATSVAEFWHRWHISLSTWFRDYLYFPLGGSRVTLPRWCFNVMVVFLISGMWHGASWNFAVWGGLHGLYLIASRLTEPTRTRLAARWLGQRLMPLRTAWRVFITFNLVSFAWIFFRAHTIADAFTVIRGIFSRGFWKLPASFYDAHGEPLVSRAAAAVSVLLIVALLVSEWADSRGDRPLLTRQPLWLRWPAYYAMGIAILWIGSLGGRTFIYFQF